MNAFKVSPNKRPLVDPAKLEAFASGAETAQKAPALDDKRRIPTFAIRLTEREQDALRRIAETTPDSMHAFCVKAIREKLGWLARDSKDAP